MLRVAAPLFVLSLLGCGRSLPFDATLSSIDHAKGGGSGGKGGGGGSSGTGGGDVGGGTGGGAGDGGGGETTGGGAGGGMACSPSLCGARKMLAGGELTTLETSVQATQVDTAYDSMGRPVVAYGNRSTSTGPTELVVRRLENGHWQRLGCSVGDPGFSTVQLATDEMGNLLVAWIERQSGPNGASLIAVAQWTEGKWLPLGAPFHFSQSDTVSNRVSLSLARGQPILAWDENDASGSSMSNGKVFVARWDGASWLPFGDALTGDSKQALELLAMAIDVDGEPAILYSPIDSTLVFHPTLRKWDGGAWQMVAAPPAPAPFVRAVGGFRIDPQGHYYLGFGDSATATVTRVPHVARFDGSSWSLLGEGFEATQDVELYDLALEGDASPVVAVTRKRTNPFQLDASILHWDGMSWSPVIGFDDFPQIDSNIAIAGGPGGEMHAIWSILQSGGFTIHAWHSVATPCQ